MRELERISGFSRATIGFYIKEGLLPAPEKSAKNMAYYGEKFILKLKLIKKLKDADFSLTQMKQILNDDKTILDINPLLNSIHSINKLLPLGTADQPVTLKQIKESGFDDDIIRNMTELSVISPYDDNNALFPSYSITLCKLAKYFMDFGIPMTVIKEFVEKLRELVTIENNAFEEYISQKEPDNSSREEISDLVLECFENINAVLPLLHMQLLKIIRENEKH